MGRKKLQPLPDRLTRPTCVQHTYQKQEEFYYICCKCPREKEFIGGKWKSWNANNDSRPSAI